MLMLKQLTAGRGCHDGNQHQLLMWALLLGSLITFAWAVLDRSITADHG